ncbi:hypothetical protein JZ751_011845, partial [Albula glossodonta]
MQEVGSSQSASQGSGAVTAAAKLGSNNGQSLRYTPPLMHCSAHFKRAGPSCSQESAGWGSDKVLAYCGPDASPYKVGLCSLGWAFYTAIGGTVLTFICAVFSAQAEIATSSDKVQEEIEEGKSLICLLPPLAPTASTQEA